MGGGAWPFLVGGVICLVNSVNERDLNLLKVRVSCGSRLQALPVLCFALGTQTLNIERSRRRKMDAAAKSQAFENIAI